MGTSLRDKNFRGTQSGGPETLVSGISSSVRSHSDFRENPLMLLAAEGIKVLC